MFRARMAAHERGRFRNWLEYLVPSRQRRLSLNPEFLHERRGVKYNDSRLSAGNAMRIALNVLALCLFLLFAVSASRNQIDSILFLAIFLGLISLLEMPIDWQEKIVSPKHLIDFVTRGRLPITFLGKACQFLSLFLLLAYFVVK
jgi:hypothetical protein